MENSYITHHGVKGQKWGVRRFQNKDGSLTLLGRRRVKKVEKAEAAKAKQKAQEERDKETTEQKRARLLKSSNAKELYENRHLLTTQELNERLQRIDTERRLGEVASKGEKSRVDKITDKLGKFVNLGKKVNEVYQLTENGLGKALKDAVSGKDAEKGIDVEKMMTKLKEGKLSYKDTADFKQYMQNRKMTESFYESLFPKKESGSTNDLKTRKFKAALKTRLTNVVSGDEKSSRNTGAEAIGKLDLSKAKTTADAIESYFDYQDALDKYFEEW
jgi:hypothetical protein